MKEMKKSVKLTVLIENHGDPDFVRDFMLENVELFMKLNPHVDIKVIAKAQAEEYEKMVDASFKSEEIIDTWGYWPGPKLKPLAESDILRDITPNLEANPEFYKNLNPDILDPCTFNGKRYAIPIGMDTELVYYNKKIFKDLGLQEPGSWDDFLNIIKVTKENGYTPIAFGNTPPWYGAHFFMQLAYRMCGKELTLDTLIQGTGKFTDQPWIDSAILLQNLVKMGTFDDKANILNAEERTAAFAEGKASMYWSMTYVSSQFIELGLEDKNIGVFSFPEVTGGKGAATELMVGPIYVFGINSRSKNPDTVFDFLKIAFSTERMKRLAVFGVIPNSLAINPEEIDGTSVFKQNVRNVNSSTGSIPFLGHIIVNSEGISNAVVRLIDLEDPVTVLTDLQKQWEERTDQEK